MITIGEEERTEVEEAGREASVNATCLYILSTAFLNSLTPGSLVYP